MFFKEESLEGRSVARNTCFKEIVFERERVFKGSVKCFKEVGRLRIVGKLTGEMS